METLLKRELGCSSVKATGHSGGGCISQGQSYDTDKGRVFVKVNSKAEVGPPALGRGPAPWPAAKVGPRVSWVCVSEIPSSSSGSRVVVGSAGDPACSHRLCLPAVHAWPPTPAPCLGPPGLCPPALAALATRVLPVVS